MRELSFCCSLSLFHMSKGTSLCALHDTRLWKSYSGEKRLLSLESDALVLGFKSDGKVRLTKVNDLVEKDQEPPVVQQQCL